MPSGTIIVYRLPSHYPAARRVRFMENVFGQDRVSLGRRSRRHGTLETTPIWRVQRGVVIVRPEDRPRVVRELERWSAEVEWWAIELNDRQWRRLASPAS